MRVIATVLARLAFSAPALAQVTVIDGDTLKVDGTIYRLWGIDAPEYRQFCDDGFPAGGMAFDVLGELVRGKTVACDPKSKDRYGRTIAICRADGLDLASMMVRSGWAWASISDSVDYARQETEALTAGTGIHAHGCLPAWEWRSRQGQSGWKHAP